VNPRPAAAALDQLARAVVDDAPLRFSTVIGSDPEADAAYRLRYDAVVAEGWVEPHQFIDGREHDDYDAAAVHVVGWSDDSAVCTCRLVLPATTPDGRLPTEAACDLRIEPAGEGMRQRHDLAPGDHFTAPGPTRQSPTTCDFAGDGAASTTSRLCGPVSLATT